MSTLNVELRAEVPWSKLRLDLSLIALALFFPLASYLTDLRAGCHDWFARSGAVTVLIAGILAYRSLAKHYDKFFNNTDRGFSVKTSRNQSVVDACALVISICGTLIWAYGDKLFQTVCH